jgi:L-histidine N-alpha-methyltransferase
MLERAEWVGEHAELQIDRAALVRDVAHGLSRPQKQLDPKYFYDERGSELFELITELPEYYLTRAERKLLELEIPKIVDRLRPFSLVELGAGSATKTRIILDAMRDAGVAERYVPVDVSRDFLEETAERLREIYPLLDITTAIADFSTRLALPPLQTPTLFVFLGSTIGNFENEAAIGILSRVAAQMQAGDRFLLGVDLRKDVSLIEAAYNDGAGVTAEFNLNVLHVLNRELAANFDPAEFSHRAFYNRELHRIEMHLDAVRDHSVFIPEIGEIQFEQGESIRTELSCKYDRSAIQSLFESAGLTMERWMSGVDGLFALALGKVQPGER